MTWPALMEKRVTMQKMSAICFRIILVPAFIYVIASSSFPVFSMTPEQCRVKTESCIRACSGSSTDSTKVIECYDRCNSPLVSCNVTGCGTSIKGTNRDPAGDLIRQRDRSKGHQLPEASKSRPQAALAASRSSNLHRARRLSSSHMVANAELEGGCRSLLVALGKPLR